MAKISGFPIGTTFTDLQLGELFVAYLPQGAAIGIKVDDLDGVGRGMLLSAPDNWQAFTVTPYAGAHFAKVGRLPNDARIEPIDGPLPADAGDVFNGSIILDTAGQTWLRVQHMQDRREYNLGTGKLGEAGPHVLTTRRWRVVGRADDQVIEYAVIDPAPKLQMHVI